MKSIGFVGLGNIGAPMARSVLRAGFKLTVFDVASEPMQAFQSLGADLGGSVFEVAQRSDVVLLSLPNDKIVKEAVLGDKGVLKGFHSGGVIIDLSTIDPETSRQISNEAQKVGVGMIDSPVSGGAVRAEKGTLTLMIGGKKEVIDENMDILSALGSKIIYMGESGSGATMKLLHNTLVAINIASTAEYCNFGLRLGIDPQKLFEVAMNGMGYSRMLESVMPFMIKHDFSPTTGKLWLTRKDVKLAAEMAEKNEIPIPLTNISYEIFESAMKLGLENEGEQSVLKVLEKLSPNSKDHKNSPNEKY